MFGDFVIFDFVVGEWVESGTGTGGFGDSLTGVVIGVGGGGYTCG